MNIESTYRHTNYNGSKQCIFKVQAMVLVKLPKCKEMFSVFGKLRNQAKDVKAINPAGKHCLFNIVSKNQNVVTLYVLCCTLGQGYAQFDFSIENS